MHCTVTRWSLAAHRCLFRMGPWARGVNRLRWVRMVCVGVRTFWRPCVSAKVILDGLHWCVWGEYANPFTGWFLEVANYLDGFRWPKSLVGDASTTELSCVAHWNVWHHLQSSSWFAASPLSFLCQRRWGLSKLFFVGMKCFCNVQLTSDYKRLNLWFN